MGAVQQYIDLYRSQKNLINSHSSAVMNGLREEAVALLESRGLPSLKDEEHRRTDIESVYSPDYGLNLGRIDIEINPYEVFRCDVPNLSTLLYFVVNDSFYKRVQPCSRQRSRLVSYRRPFRNNAIPNRGIARTCHKGCPPKRRQGV